MKTKSADSSHYGGFKVVVNWNTGCFYYLTPLGKILLERPSVSVWVRENHSLSEKIQDKDVSVLLKIRWGVPDKSASWHFEIYIHREILHCYRRFSFQQTTTNYLYIDITTPNTNREHGSQINQHER